MDALQPPRPLDKKRKAFDMAHISSLWLTETPPPLQPFLVAAFCFIHHRSFGTHGNIREPFVPSQCCGHKSYRDLFDSLSSD